MPRPSKAQAIQIMRDVLVSSVILKVNSGYLKLSQPFSGSIEAKQTGEIVWLSTYIEADDGQIYGTFVDTSRPDISLEDLHGVALEAMEQLILFDSNPLALLPVYASVEEYTEAWNKI